MKIIAQNINIFSPRVYEAVKRQDGSFIQRLARALVENGADGLELNLGGWRTSDEAMPWLVRQVRKVSRCPLFLSPIPSSLKDAVEAAKTGDIFINCVTADRARLESMFSGARCLDTSVVVLLTRTGLCPTGLEQVLLLAEEVIERAEKAGLSLERLVLDPVLRPRLFFGPDGRMVNRPDPTFFAEAISLIGMLRERRIQTAAGIGNLTMGMPQEMREGYEASALKLLKGAGLDYAIMDCSNRRRILDARCEEAVFPSAPLNQGASKALQI